MGVQVNMEQSSISVQVRFNDDVPNLFIDSQCVIISIKKTCTIPINLFLIITTVLLKYFHMKGNISSHFFLLPDVKTLLVFFFFY